MNIVYNLYNYLHNKCSGNKYNTDSTFINQFAHIEYLENDEDFIEFKNNNMEFGKLIFVLNNFPEKIYETIFSKYDINKVCQKYYNIVITKLHKKKLYYILS